MKVIISGVIIFIACLGGFASKTEDLLLEAEAAKATGDSVQAESLFKTLLGLEPGNKTANFELGLIFQEQREYSEAVAYYNTAASAGLLDANLYYNRALCQLELGKVGAARADAATALGLKPGDSAILIMSAMVEIADGQNKAAVEFIKSALKSHNVGPSQIRQIAILAENCGDYGLALTSAETYLSIRPEDQVIERLRARVLSSLGNGKFALQAWKELAIKTGKKEDYLGWVQTARSSGDDTAKSTAAQVFYKEFQDPQYLIELGDDELEKGNYAAAESMFTELKPADSQKALWNLAVAQEKQGKLELARATWQIFLKISTDKKAQATVREHLNQLNITAPSPPPDLPPPNPDTERQEQGIKLAQEASELCDNHKYSEALPKWQAAIERMPERVELVYNLAGTLEKMNRLKEAASVWQQYLGMNITQTQKTDIEKHMDDLIKEMHRQIHESFANGF